MAIIVLIALLLVVAFSINNMLKKRKGNKGEMDSAE
ncbi:FeoB-associated Cys-rich membrane protein [Phocaeicola massiliensis]